MLVTKLHLVQSVLYCSPSPFCFFGVCEELPKDVAGVATVGVTEPTGVTMTEDESTDVDESNEFIDIVDLALFLRLGDDNRTPPRRWIGAPLDESDAALEGHLSR